MTTDYQVGTVCSYTNNLILIIVLGELPAKLGNLSLLEILDLHSNKLSGSVPPSVSTMKKLIRVNFNSNQFSGNLRSPLLRLLLLLLYLILLILQLLRQVDYRLCLLRPSWMNTTSVTTRSQV